MYKHSHRAAKRGDTYVDGVNGYIVECVKGHPLFPGRAWVYQHRRILAERLGRPLEHWEIAHHDDENGLNNKSENIVYTTRVKHPTLHIGAKRSEKTKRLLSISAKRRCTPEWRAAVSKRVKEQHRQGKHWYKRKPRFPREPLFPRLEES